jgi:hypothetical protein
MNIELTKGFCKLCFYPDYDKDVREANSSLVDTHLKTGEHIMKLKERISKELREKHGTTEIVIVSGQDEAMGFCMKHLEQLLGMFKEKTISPAEYANDPEMGEENIEKCDWSHGYVDGANARYYDTGDNAVPSAGMSYCQGFHIGWARMDAVIKVKGEPNFPSHKAGPTP